MGRDRGFRIQQVICLDFVTRLILGFPIWIPGHPLFAATTAIPVACVLPTKQPGGIGVESKTFIIVS